MNERSIFLNALEKEDPIQRAAYLDTACAGDTVLRQRLEALLQSHDQAGDFLGKLAPERIAEEIALQHSAEDTDLGFLTPTDKTDALGRLGHYEILEVIGRGGMGIVLRAFDEKLHRVVAIKVMAAQLATNAAARKRFTREAQAQAAVSHDHVVTIHAVEEANGLPYLVMQFISGMSLQERLDKRAPLQLAEVVRIAMQTAAGLAAAHAQGLIHRDIKPANILLENGVERVKITDFGLARAAADASLTQSGVVAGTPHYMSPEQARGEAVDQRGDLFSLGSVLYAMCTGRTPFRASGSMAVLKRVCEETPTPIRETNPEVPDWLVAIIDKLQAKDPAERYQSAAEVAELLGRYLAHVQHPSLAPLPAAAASAEREPAAASLPTRAPRARKRRWVLAAAAAALLVLGGLAIGEASGVTNLRATVIRIFTPDGTLVVEVDDPGVKVTVEGDGGLAIAGAGLEEIRLRPGSYKVHADRDGKEVPLERELVRIAKGGREVVKVKLEAVSERAPAAKGAKSAFVLLAAGKERKFDSLAEAVQATSDGDTIEIRGNGAFVTGPVRTARPLTIRAGAGFRPVLELGGAGVRAGATLLRADDRLVLEGLSFHLTGHGLPQYGADRPWPALIGGRGPVWIANCSFLSEGGTRAIHLDEDPVLTVRNSQFVMGEGLTHHFGPTGRIRLQNNVIATWRMFPVMMPVDHTLRDTRYHLDHNTLIGEVAAMQIVMDTSPEVVTGDSKPATPPLLVQAAANIFDGQDAAVSFQSFPPPAAFLAQPTETEEFLRRLVEWREARNLYADQPHLLRPWLKGKRLQPTWDTLADWKRLWKLGELDSTRGRIRYHGGDVLSKFVVARDHVTAADFRLRPDSAGYRAGKDGKDLGADIDLVGPGPAYEGWKKTPEYQQWLKETGQAK
jgi:hypothetical protein